ncbi:A-kinase anchor protein SPHKAP [Acipenser ruthenus]|uniref:A-kinase anchor protein SPHKAP n=1 Tax=Acipenser ruthenus TaxID=7906 RepID=A0A444UMP7_ACIRT|nr:A-kinase anchor protein SPHKAP [Acipenser ruthenus]
MEMKHTFNTLSEPQILLPYFLFSNSEATSMFELSENLEDPHGAGGDSSDSTLGSSVTACKKVLCSSSLLESTEYWLRNEGALCRIGFMEDKTDHSCTTICFVNLDGNSADCSDEKFTQKLATVSPDLPKLIDSLNVRQPKENEIFLLSGLDACDNLQTDSDYHQSCRAANVCLVQCAREKKEKKHPSCIIYEINKFLIGLESGQERQLQLDRSGIPRPEDDTNRSVSSIEEDFLTASEHLDDESEEDGFRNDGDNNDATDLFSDVRNTGEMRLGSQPNKKTPYSESGYAAAGGTLHSTDKPMKQHHCNVPLPDTVEHQADHQKKYQSTCQRQCAVRSSGSAQPGKATRDGRHTVNVANTRQSSNAQSDMQFPLQNTQPSASHYATNLAESVLQDAFIKLSQAEATFTTEAALSVSAGHTILTASTEETKPTQTWDELPKIVIVQKLKERLMNRVVDESMNFDEPPDPFSVFANAVTAKIMNCPELSVVDTSKQGQSQPRNRLHCDRWSKGKASSYESIPEEDANSSSLINTLGPGTMLGQNLSRGGSISKQSSCESITDEFSRFMVNQMENEGRGFDLLLDYYAEQNAVNILSSALQQVTKKNGHLNVRSTCLSKQSSTESITEEFYRFMIKEMDNENKDYSVAKTKAWSNSFLAPSPRTSFCVRQSSVPDRRSSDSRLTVNAPVKANSFDGFARNVHADTLNIYPVNTVSSTGLCKSDSCLYKRGGTDQITDMLIHETWSSSIESLMRKNKIIVDDDDSMDLDQPENGSQSHVEQFASRLAADIIERGTSLIGGQQDPVDCQLPIPVAEKRRCFRSKTQSHFKKPALDKIQLTQDQKPTVANDSACIASPPRCPREVPLIHIEADQREEFNEDIAASAFAPGKPKTECLPDEKHPELLCQKNIEQPSINQSSPACYKTLVTAVADKASVSEECPNTLSCSDDSTGSWSQVANEEDPPEDTSSYLQLSEGNGNSSASSSLGLVDLEGLQEAVSPCTLISKIVEEKKILKENQYNLDECTSGLSVGTNSCHKDLLVMNFDLEPDCVDSELRATLQWIAASELGVPTIYFIRSQEKRIEKFLDVVRFVQQKAWNVGDLFRAIVQYCKLQEENADAVSSLFDWLLDLS